MSAPAPLVEPPSPPPPPAPPGPPPARRRWPRVWFLLGPMMLLTLVLVIASAVYTAPYSILAPGDASLAAPLVQVSGAKTYTHPGKVLFVTVAVTDQPTFIESLWGWLDPDVDVFPRNDVTAGRSVADDNRYNAMLMQISQQSATYQALKRVGFDVSQTAAGVLVDDVAPHTAADGKLKAGDVIVGIDGFSINSTNDLAMYLEQRTGGEHVPVIVNRLGVKDDLKVYVTLGSREVSGAKRAYLGITMEQFTRYHDPLSVAFDTGNVGGPSAGLSFTVTLIDKLTPGGVTNGNTVAITGTMQPDGTVGDVGGVAQKTVAVRDSGADYFLVPGDEYADAEKHAGGHLKVIKVATLDQALSVLHSLPKKVH